MIVACLDLDGDHGDGKKWKDWRNAQALDSNWRLNSSGEEGISNDSCVSGIGCWVDVGPFYKQENQEEEEEEQVWG